MFYTKQVKLVNTDFTYKKSEIKLITDNFREIITIYGFKYNKKRLSKLRRAIRDLEKIVIDKKEDDIEYLQDRINYLNSLKNGYAKQNQYQDKNIKYHGIETIRYLFNDDDEDYNLHPTNYQQYQSFSGKTLLRLIVPSRVGTPPPPFSEGTPPPLWVPPLSEANLKIYPSF